MKGLTIKEINIGDKAFFQKTVTETDVYLYAGITGDLNKEESLMVCLRQGLYQLC